MLARANAASAMRGGGTAMEAITTQWRTRRGLEHRRKPLRVATVVGGEDHRHRAHRWLERRRQGRPAVRAHQSPGADAVALVHLHVVVVLLRVERGEAQLDGRRAGDEPCALHVRSVVDDRDGDGRYPERHGLSTIARWLERSCARTARWATQADGAMVVRIHAPDGRTKAHRVRAWGRLRAWALCCRRTVQRGLPGEHRADALPPPALAAHGERRRLSLFCLGKSAWHAGEALKCTFACERARV
jgi:hypothetical protein